MTHRYGNSGNGVATCRVGNIPYILLLLILLVLRYIALLVASLVVASLSLVSKELLFDFFFRFCHGLFAIWNLLFF
jgi:hypothetical protein